MTVRELIEELQKYASDTVVVLRGTCKATEVVLDTEYVDYDIPECPEVNAVVIY